MDKETAATATYVPKKVAITLALCLAAGAPFGACQAEVMDVYSASEPVPSWATDAWVDYAARIVYAETVPGCAECTQWIACTVVRDVQRRGYDPWRLHPGRWCGQASYAPEEYRDVVRHALSGGCGGVPHCRFLGNVRDYLVNWSGLGPGLIVGNERAGIVCVPE